MTGAAGMCRRPDDFRLRAEWGTGIAKERLYLQPSDCDGCAWHQGTHQGAGARFCRRDPQGPLAQTSTLAESSNQRLEGNSQLVAEPIPQFLHILHRDGGWVMEGIIARKTEEFFPGQDERGREPNGIAGEAKRRPLQDRHPLLAHECTDGEMGQVERIATQGEARQHLALVRLVVRGHCGEVRIKERRISLEDGLQQEAAHLTRIAQMYPEVRVGEAQSCQRLRQG